MNPSSITRDVRDAIRMLLRNPGFTTIALLTFAVGIGVNTAVFSVFNGVLLRPLPCPDADRITMMWLDNRLQGIKEDIGSYPSYRDWREQNSSFEHVAAFNTPNFAMTGSDEPERIRGALHKQMVGDVERSLLVLMAAVGCVLLIACANLGNLMLGRTAARRKELAIRTALGARRGRLVRQIVTETFVVAIAGSALGLLLASVGIYGVTAHTVSQRTQEVGVRMALGAQRRDVLRLVLTRALRIVVAGLIVGLAGAAGVTRVLQTFLFGVAPTDPIVFTIVTLLLMAVGLMAAWLPARRATRIDPCAALRAE